MQKITYLVCLMIAVQCFTLHAMNRHQAVIDRMRDLESKIEADAKSCAYLVCLCTALCLPACGYPIPCYASIGIMCACTTRYFARGFFARKEIRTIQDRLFNINDVRYQAP